MLSVALNSGPLYGVSWLPSGGCIAGGVSAGRSDPLHVVKHKPGDPLAKAVGDRPALERDYAFKASVANVLGVSSLGVSSDGSLAVTAGHGSDVAFFNLDTRERVKLVVSSPSEAQVCAMTPVAGESMAATGGAKGAVAFWDASTGEKTGASSLPCAFVASLAFNADGAMLAAGGIDGSVHIVDTASKGVILSVSDAHALPIRAVAFSSDSRTLFTGSDDRRVAAWDVSAVLASLGSGATHNSAPLIYTLSGHHHWVTSLDFSASRGLLASASADRTVKVWDPVKRELKLTLEGVASGITAAKWAPDGTAIAAVTDDGTLARFPVPATL